MTMIDLGFAACCWKHSLMGCYTQKCIVDGIILLVCSSGNLDWHPRALASVLELFTLHCFSAEHCLPKEVV